LISLVSFAGFFARTGGLFNVIPLRAEDRLGLDPAQIGLGLTMVSVVGLLFSYPSGVLVDRFGRKAVIVPSTILNGVAMLLFAIVSGYVWFLVACFFWSIASGISGAAPAAYAADTAPSGMTASALGSYRMIADFGYVAGPLLLGGISDLATPEAALILTALMLIAIGSTFARYAPETLVRPSPAPAPAPAAAGDG
jgi:MFS family permease